MNGEDLIEEEKERLNAISREKLKILRNIEALKTELHDITKQIESLGFPPECEDPIVRRRLIGCKTFETDPKKGLEFLFEHELLDRTPDAVAKFFMDDNEQLSKYSIGTYLGEVRKDFNMQVLDAFTKLHDFRNMEFLPSLRSFLLTFQLPGESQKIDKVLTSFASHYIEQNPSVFKSEHDAYVLAYAAILLNTTLHNSNTKGQSFALAEEKKFVKALLDYDSETDLPETLIRQVYHGIKSEPFQSLTTDEIDLPSVRGKVIHKGHLLKLAGRVRTWKRRFFILTEDNLVYYTSNDRHRQMKGMIALNDLGIRLCQDRTKENVFELFSCRNESIKRSKSEKDGATSSTPSNRTVYRLAADTAADRDKWIRNLEAVTHRIAERRAFRSVSAGSSAAAVADALTSGNGDVMLQCKYSLPGNLSSTSFKRTPSSGSYPDIPSQNTS